MVWLGFSIFHIDLLNTLEHHFNVSGSNSGTKRFGGSRARIIWIQKNCQVETSQVELLSGVHYRVKFNAAIKVSHLHVEAALFLGAKIVGLGFKSKCFYEQTRQAEAC